MSDKVPMTDADRYIEWARGYGDGITCLGAVLSGAPLDNLPEDLRAYAKRWIDSHDKSMREDRDRLVAERDAAVSEVCDYQNDYDCLRREHSALIERCRALAEKLNKMASDIRHLQPSGEPQRRAILLSEIATELLAILPKSASKVAE